MSETVAPVVAEPVVAPVAPVAEVVTAPVEATPPPVVAPEVVTAPEPTTVLGDALKPAPIPPVEPAPAPEPAKVEGQSDEPAPPPTYEPFTLPEGITVEADKIGEFTNLLGEFEGKTKADHAAVQALGQQLVERHVAEIQRLASEMQKSHANQMAADRVAWKEQFLGDPEIGGNRFQSTVDSAVEFIRTHGGSEGHQAEFRALMDKTGLGDHPVMLRMFSNANRAMSEGQPLAAQRPAAPPKSNTQKMYGRG